MTALEVLAVADVTAEMIGVRVEVACSDHTHAGVLSDVVPAPAGSGPHVIAHAVYAAGPALSADALCLDPRAHSHIYVAGEHLELAHDTTATIRVARPIDPCDGAPMPEERLDEPGVQPADTPSATTVDATDECRADPRGARCPSAVGARPARPAVTGTPSERPRTSVWRRAHLAARRALRAAGPALVIVVAVACITAGLLQAVTAPRVSGDTIAAVVAVTVGGGLLMRLLWISERRAGLR